MIQLLAARHFDALFDNARVWTATASNFATGALSIASARCGQEKVDREESEDRRAVAGGYR